MILGFFFYNRTDNEVIFIYDENNKPIQDVYLISREANIILPLLKNKRFIGKSDAEGKIVMQKMKGLVHLTVGKEGFYPSRIDYNEGKSFKGWI